MNLRTKRAAIVAAAGLGAAALVAGTTLSTTAAANPAFTNHSVASANPRQGVEDNVLAFGLREKVVAWGGLPLVGASTVGGVSISHYGYTWTAADTTLTQSAHEARKSEPDKNVYLVFNGHHYLYQGHEGAPVGYVTRIDLDATSPATRVKLIADHQGDSTALPSFDGITWDPFSHQLLLTAEAKSPTGGVWAVTLDADGNATGTAAKRLDNLGSGGYEGIQNDSAGNLWLVEDIGGAAAGTNGKGKKPNSYVYRYVPTDKADPGAGGTMQALQVTADGNAVTAAQLQANPSDPFLAALHTYGASYPTQWVDAKVTDNTAYDVTAAAKSAGATPFKRPENGVFRPGSNFSEFYFTETGDTNDLSDLPGAFGGVFRIKQDKPTAKTGVIEPVVLGDHGHTGFDNISFAGVDDLLVVEDAGDTFHSQRNVLDSGWDARLSNDDARAASIDRWLAEGRDASSEYDARVSPGYNDGDNEVTGIHVSDGDPSVDGILGAKKPHLFDGSWRGFWTQQHGDNVTWELSRAE